VGSPYIYWHFIHNNFAHYSLDVFLTAGFLERERRLAMMMAFSSHLTVVSTFPLWQVRDRMPNFDATFGPLLERVWPSGRGSTLMSHFSRRVTSRYSQLYSVNAFAPRTHQQRWPDTSYELFDMWCTML
jgi:hypothetical protein